MLAGFVVPRKPALRCRWAGRQDAALPGSFADSAMKGAAPHEVGYDFVAAFCRAFEKAKGVTPAA